MFHSALRSILAQEPLPQSDEWDLEQWQALESFAHDLGLRDTDQMRWHGNTNQQIFEDASLECDACHHVFSGPDMSQMMRQVDSALQELHPIKSMWKPRITEITDKDFMRTWIVQAYQHGLFTRHVKLSLDYRGVPPDQLQDELMDIWINGEWTCPMCHEPLPQNSVVYAWSEIVIE
eukprot:TRINITY_DN831_c0_g1_i6.p2 TRINITY_DN831_c0_g1~~TRINITY_DN831_c0_g1_i6.p2  ORF type:complete len:177 (-),score=15.17 TRINITY_DN831_c0_g1_i6:222-752(-)